jgi:hypothetical protein
MMRATERAAELSLDLLLTRGLCLAPANRLFLAGSVIAPAEGKNSLWAHCCEYVSGRGRS